MTTLKAEPGEEVTVRNDRPEQDTEFETAEADENGVVRDVKGRSYSSGAYSIVKEGDA